MQLCHATVRLRGLTTNEVRRINITVPEALVLQEVHGEGSLVGMVYAGQLEDFNAAAEKRRLMATYPRMKDRIEALFPGYDPRMPTKWSETPLSVNGVNQHTGAKAGGKKRAETEPVNQELDKDTLRKLKAAADAGEVPATIAEA